MWEIDPVYAIDVCVNKSLSGCPAKNDAKWLSLDEWLNEEQEEDD